MARILVAVAVRADMGLFKGDVPDHLRDEAVIAEAARIAEDNKLLGEFAAGLAALGVSPPLQFMARLVSYKAFARRKARQALLSLTRVDKAMSAASIPWVAYKGQTLQIHLGLGPAHRPANDVDILVRRSDFDGAVAALRQSGCMTPPAFATPWWRDCLGEMALIPAPGSGPPIDVHHKVQQPGCPGPRNTEGLLSGAEHVVFDDVKIPTLSSVNAVLMGAICVVKAFARHEEGGSHVVDLARLLIRLDEQAGAAVRAAAKGQRLTKTLALARMALNSFLHDPLDLSLREQAEGIDWLGMILTPDSNDHQRLRGRMLLWQLSDGNPVTRVFRFVRDSIEVVRTERLRIQYEQQDLPTEGFTVGKG